MKVYVAGKMSAHSEFSSHEWRDEFLSELSELSGISFVSYDPTLGTKDYQDSELVFGSDVHMISQVDLVIVYLSDDISVGASQEILIAKYYSKPVIAFAKPGSKFKVPSKEIAGTIIKDYRHPFVYSTCDLVCEDMEELAEALKHIDEMEVKTLDIIKNANARFEKLHLENKLYQTKTIK